MSQSLGEPTLPKLIYRGAEAEIYLEDWYGSLAIRKSRIAKAYRVPELDSAIRRARTLHETSLMHEARKIGIPVPAIQHLDPGSSTFVMDYVNGPTLKDELYMVSARERERLCRDLGRIVGQMHSGGLVHGDLTISNIISTDEKLFMIDFGLGDHSTQPEDWGVDLLLLNRAVKSTHAKLHQEVFRAFLKGYATLMRPKHYTGALEKMREIERRGRYFERA